MTMKQTPEAPAIVEPCEQCGEEAEGCEVTEPEWGRPYHACFKCQDAETEAEAAAEHEAKEQAYRNTTAASYMTYWRARGIDPEQY